MKVKLYFEQYINNLAVIYLEKHMHVPLKKIAHCIVIGDVFIAFNPMQGELFGFLFNQDLYWHQNAKDSGYKNEAQLTSRFLLLSLMFNIKITGSSKHVFVLLYSK